MFSPNQATRPFPVADALPSYWRKHAHSIDEYRSTPDLPDHCDIVIIGAGYSGASIAHHLIEQTVSRNRQIPSILILEAREACSGATGRNGGHLKPDPLFRAANVLKSHGKAAAEHVASFEARQVSEVRDLIEQEGIDCDFEETTVTDVCTYSEGRDAIKASLSEVAKAAISTAKEIQYFEGDEACEVSGVRGAKCCLTYNAARLWPYRLVSHLLEKAISQGINLQTHTPVLTVTPASETLEALPWSVKTPRGSVRCHTVIHATNAYSSALLPELRDKIVPVRGVVARLVGEDVPKMTDSFMMRFSQYEYDYMIPRPDRSIVVGGARRDHYADLDEWFNVTDDSKVTKSAREYFDGYMQRHFRGWENSDTRTEELWTGVMGYSNDGFPYVGKVCAKDGQYVCAGFTGHGMPQIFLSAKAIALMITTGATEEEADLPIPYRVSPDRWFQDKEHESLKAWRNVTKKMHPHANL